MSEHAYKSPSDSVSADAATDSVAKHREIDRPLVTFALIAYNQERFIREAVEGAFAQKYSPLEIILSDDASSDRTFDVMRQLVADYHGPHEVILNRNEANRGLAGHVNHLMGLARGDIILLAAGDDISRPQRSARAVELLGANRDCLSVSFETIRFRGSAPPNSRDIQGSANAAKYSREIYLADPSFHLNGAARAFRRCVFEFFGPISPDCPTEDSVILLRCLLLGYALSSREVQVYYRLHGENLYASPRKHDIDYDTIHRQHLRDLKVAAERGLLCSDERETLEKSLEKRLTRRKLLCGFSKASNRLGFFLGSIATSKVIGRRQKLRMLWLALTGRSSD